MNIILKIWNQFLKKVKLKIFWFEIKAEYKLDIKNGWFNVNKFAVDAGIL